MIDSSALSSQPEDPTAERTPRLKPEPPPDFRLSSVVARSSVEPDSLSAAVSRGPIADSYQR